METSSYRRLDKDADDENLLAEECNTTTTTIDKPLVRRSILIGMILGIILSVCAFSTIIILAESIQPKNKYTQRMPAWSPALYVFPFLYLLVAFRDSKRY